MARKRHIKKRLKQFSLPVFGEVYMIGSFMVTVAKGEKPLRECVQTEAKANWFSPEFVESILAYDVNHGSPTELESGT